MLPLCFLHMKKIYSSIPKKCITNTHHGALTLQDLGKSYCDLSNWPRLSFTGKCMVKVLPPTVNCCSQSLKVLGAVDDFLNS